MRWLRLVAQISLLPPININLNFPRRWVPPKDVNIPRTPPPRSGFDPKRKVSNYEARIYAASNSLEETRK
jgi:hypothetical protein